MPHTGEQIAPEKRQAILESIKAGTGILATAAMVHASPNTVQAVRDSDPSWKQDQSETLKRFTRMITTDMVNMTPEQLAQVPLQQKAITLGVVIDKILLLDGEPTSIHEIRHSADVSSLTSVLTQHVEIDVTESAQLPADYQQTPETKGITPDSQG